MNNLKWIDTHAHLYLLKHGTTDEILERATQNSIEKIITVSVDEPSWLANYIDAQKYPYVYYSVGMHPHDAKDYAKKKAFLENFIHKNKNPKLVAIGETGLDFYYENSSKEEQLSAFKDQIRIAAKHNLPIIIHCRDAFKDLFDCLNEVGIPDKKGVMHCFTGTTDEALKSIEMGFYISFSGILTFKTASALRETLKKIPLDKILFETDCPFLAPMPNRGKPNEPSFLPLTAKVAAETLEMPIEKIGYQVYKNTLKLFGL